MRNALMGLVAGVAIVAAWWWYDQNVLGFTDAELRRLEGQIVAEYQKRPAASDISAHMIRVSRNAATGYAAFKIGAADIRHTCTAQMEQNSTRYVWSCTP